MNMLTEMSDKLFGELIDAKRIVIKVIDKADSENGYAIGFLVVGESPTDIEAEVRFESNVGKDDMRAFVAQIMHELLFTDWEITVSYHPKHRLLIKLHNMLLQCDTSDSIY